MEYSSGLKVVSAILLNGSMNVIIHIAVLLPSPASLLILLPLNL